MRLLCLLGVLLLTPLSAHAQPSAPAPAAPNPHAGAAAQKKEPPLRQDPALPRSTIVVSVVDATGAPIKNRPVRLLQKFRSIAQGEAEETFTRSTGADGQVRFDSLGSDTAYSYQATVTEGPAVYASPAFNLREGGGQRVVLSVYKVTRNINDARVGIRGLAYVQPRDDVFQFEFWFQIFSAGPLTWVPQNVTFALPEGSKAFNAQESTGDLRVEELDGRAVLRGTVSPGQHDVRFSFQVESEHTDSESFDLSLLPHVAEFRVVVESSPDMRLTVPGFPPVQVSEGPSGNRVLVTQARKENLRSVHVQIAGLPTRGSAPWIAVSLALLAALSGVFGGGRSGGDEEASKRRSKEAKKARELLLGELMLLEKQRQAGAVGPRTYEQARLVLLNAVGRLLEARQALGR